jgi:anti-sigma B factor antagonist
MVETGMQIEERAAGGVTVLAVSGEITLNSGGGQALKEKVAALLQEGRRQLVLELGGVTYVDSAGLGQLVQVQLTTTGEGGTVKLANTGPRLRQLLAVAKLSGLFDAHEKESAAVASFGAAV